MSLSGKLQKWADAGLITADQQSRIIEHERGHSAGRWKHGVIFAGLFSILLGIALIVAANWQDITWQTKLVTHFTINIILATLVWRWREDPLREKHREVALFFLWGLTLTLIALIGQVFQLGGQAVDALRLWFWITAPMILLFARSAFITKIWALAFIVYVPYDIVTHIADWSDSPNFRLAVGLETAIGIPVITWLFATWPRFAIARPEMSRALHNASILLALVTASLAGTVFYASSDDGYRMIVPLFYTVAVIVIHYLLQSLKNWTQDQRGAIDLLCLAGLFICVPFVARVEADVLGMLHFIAFWLLAGAIWQQGGHARAVSFAIMMVTLRLFIGFVELFGSMMMSGFGFIIMGLVLIGLVQVARRFDKRLKELA